MPNEVIVSPQIVEEKQEFGAIVLPKMNELTTDAVVRQMQDVFKGFEYDPDLKPSEKFKDAESAEKHVAAVAEDIRKSEKDFKIRAVQNEGALEARRWYFGWLISKCLSNAAYGSDMASKLAKAANMSIAYLYQYRAVGDKMTIKEAYMLGMYGMGWELIRELAALSDDGYRKALIKTYIDSIPDWNNSVVREQARLTIKEAINLIKKSPEALSIDNKAQLEAIDEFQEGAPEFIECDKEVDRLKTRMRGFIKRKVLDPYYKACGDCYLVSNVPGASEHLERFKGSIAEALELLNSVREELPLIEQELQSLQNMKLLDPDDNV